MPDLWKGMKDRGFKGFKSFFILLADVCGLLDWKEDSSYLALLALPQLFSDISDGDLEQSRPIE